MAIKVCRSRVQGIKRKPPCCDFSRAGGIIPQMLLQKRDTEACFKSCQLFKCNLIADAADDQLAAIQQSMFLCWTSQSFKRMPEIRFSHKIAVYKAFQEAAPPMPSSTK